MISDPEKAVALVSRARDVLKDALEDLETELEDQETGKTIAERLINAYGLEPFILRNGRLGIHFMELSWSSDDGEETLIEQVREEIDVGRNRDGSIADEERADLQAWRNTLSEALAEIDAALNEPHT